MNNPKTALPIVLAFALGGFAGYIITKKLLAEKYAEEAQIEIDSIKEYWREKNEGDKDNSKNYPHSKSLQKPDLHTLVKPYSTSVLEQFDEEANVRYFDSEEEEAQAQMDEALALEAQEEFNEEMQAEADPDVDPYLISYAEFCKKSDVYDKVDLYYYRLDDILCDTKDTIMQNPEDILGWDWMKEMQKINTAFVRNEKLKIDYEIYPITGAFSDEVASRLETDKERKYRRIARQKKAMDDIATEHIEDRDEEGEYVIARPQKAKAKSTARRSSSIDYSSVKKIKSIEDAEELDDEEE